MMWYVAGPPGARTKRMSEVEARVLRETREMALGGRRCLAARAMSVGEGISEEDEEEGDEEGFPV